MEIVVIIILIISLLGVSLQMTFFPKQWVRWIYASGIALGIYLAYPRAIEESYASIRQAMTNAGTIVDFSALVILEGLLGCLLCIFQIRLIFGQRLRKWWRYAFYFTGIVFVISVYYLEALLFISIRGISFQILAIALTAIVPLLILTMHFFLRWLMPEDDLRTEMKFFLHLAQIIFAIILSVTVLKVPVADVTQNNGIVEFGTTLLFALVCIIAGYIYYRIKLKKRWKL